MKSIKGTETEKNMKAAFAGESMARNRYTFFSEQAKKEGHTEVAELFERMAKNESAHAKIWYKYLNDGIGDTMSNVAEAAQNENVEWRSMYPEFAKAAREEGLDDVAVMFERVAAIEEDHERTFLKTMIEMGKKGKSQSAVEQQAVKQIRKVPGYRCMFCGAVFEERHDVCPVCEAIGSYESATIEKEV